MLTLKRKPRTFTAPILAPAGDDGLVAGAAFPLQEGAAAGEGDIGVNIMVLPQFFHTAFGMMDEGNMMSDFLFHCLARDDPSPLFLQFHTAQAVPRLIVTHLQDTDSLDPALLGDDRAVCRGNLFNFRSHKILVRVERSVIAQHL